MHKIRVIESTLGYPQKNRMESESYEGVQTYMDMKDGSLIALADLPTLICLSIKFLYVRSVLCLRLPLDAESLRTPLPSAVRLPI